MTARRARALGPTILLVVAGVLVLLGAAAAWAEDPPAPADVAKATQDEPGATAVPPEIAESPAAIATMLVVLLGACVGGIVVLVRAWLRWDRVRGGLVPLPVAVVPTAPFRLGASLGLLLLSMVATYAVSTAVLKWRGVDPKDFDASVPYLLCVQAGIGLPLAAVVGLRRLRLARPPPPSAGRAAAIGARTWCVAVVLVLPVQILSYLLLQALGRQPTQQELVDLALDSGQPSWTPLAIAVYGVTIAPVIEETFFRGMLYPAIRTRLRGIRGAWVSALVTAALFAAVHQHVSALLPLFALALVLAFTFERTNSLAGVIVAHGLFNLGSLLPVLVARFT